ncbi:endo-1,4-beta-xylanase [Mucilaginibacter pineti]|uniref:Endo-1,4-beta-xylanase n=1 Tax=Mucilaginibacter pineti TaxID=1391627 RepID=A0A1G6Z2U0_9SPHI|nr:endo-1,4-beta-xylanase [Mucilaginibacter pineti]SDD96940.1 endo-1,4-beta-xylanase [Mucilaginibacter pineti]
MITKESRLPISAQKHVLRIAFVCALYSGCLLKTVSAQPLIRDDDKGLKDYYKAYFPIGAAVSIRSLKGDEANLILREFNSITPENDMKMGPIHPREDFYNWRNADSILDFAIKHHIRIRGHNLLWHAQAPAWMFKDSNQSSMTLFSMTA